MKKFNYEDIKDKKVKRVVLQVCGKVYTTTHLQVAILVDLVWDLRKMDSVNYLGEEESQRPELSVHAIKGRITADTMRVDGFIKHRRLVVLVDK